MTTQTELISTIAERTEFGKGQVTRMLATMIEICRQAMLAEDEVHLTGFGKFSIHESAPRQGRNPRTGEVIKIPAMRNVKFKASKSLKDELNPQPAARRRRA